MNLKKHWKPVIDKFHSKLSNWKSKMLSLGLPHLVKSVLGSLTTYYLLLFKSPICIIDELEKVRCRFLWGGYENFKKIIGCPGVRLLLLRTRVDRELGR